MAKAYLINIRFHDAYAGEAGARAAFASKANADAALDKLELARIQGKDSEFLSPDAGYYEIEEIEVSPKKPASKLKKVKNISAPSADVVRAYLLHVYESAGDWLGSVNERMTFDMLHEITTDFVIQSGAYKKVDPNFPMGNDDADYVIKAADVLMKKSGLADTDETDTLAERMTKTAS